MKRDQYQERGEPEAIWILGGTGRSGQTIASQLIKRGLSAVLVGRDAGRLQSVVREVGGTTRVSPSVATSADAIRQEKPHIVINTVGPFTTTAPLIMDACHESGSHYIDLANDPDSLAAAFERHERAVSAGHSVITGAGFGVTATESVVVRLCEGRPSPVRVRVDMLPSMAVPAGVAGEALVGSLLGGLQGRMIRDDKLVAAPIGAEALTLTLPDGTTATTAGMPLGELLAAHRASGAPTVLSASSEAPSSPVSRALLSLTSTLMRWDRLRLLATRGLGRIPVRAKAAPREHSWGHALVTWEDGETREGWLRLGEAQQFTGTLPAEIAQRLLAGTGRPGVFTPAALFGPELAESCGGVHLPDS
ncbi:saccharopine dehydrogenase NADP-binding domain-containing protein [Brevibacterium zhoupengii]|uniref:saccharopine dehydrogenase NADP-binding domain-containing protein n=1 Tax=Brevibacterium zhoupengii TaxID=2898795 RepID=UPI001E2A81B9|nr:saccharopine dehydrogenase NADP-binding domain-containing protein [Brevibacterium zhoupengii]